MKICIEIPDDVAGDGWIQEIVSEGADMCWHSDDVNGLEKSLAIVEAIAHIVEHKILPQFQQEVVDDKLKDVAA